MIQKSTVVKRNSKTDEDNFLGWDALIRDARKRIEDLMFSIKVFEKRKATGEPCPGAQSKGQNSEQQHRV